jgi:hypothetical protein
MTTAKIHQRLKDLELYVEVELLTLKNEIREHEPQQFKEGKWYICEDIKGTYLFNYKGGGYSFGLFRGDWDPDWRTPEPCDPVWHGSLPRLATPEEIESLLIAEVKKKLEGKGKIKSLRTISTFEDWNGCGGDRTACDEYNSNKLGSRYYYNPETDTLYNWGYGLAVVYEAGKFAEIIEQPVTIAGEKVEYNTDVVIIGDSIFTPSLIRHVDTLLNNKHVTGIEVTKCNGEKVIVKKHEIETLLKNWK